MIDKAFVRFGCAALALALAGGARAQEAAQGEAPAGQAAAEAPKTDPELAFAIRYVEALIDNAYPDYAAPVIEETKKRWPEAEAPLFAIEIRGMLALGDFAGAEKRIAQLPDRKSTKFWAARLEVANNYFARNKKDQCVEIYDAFFKQFPTCPKDIREFYVNASYAYGQLLFADKKYDKAAGVYAGLLKIVKNDDWCNLASETAKIYLKAADELSSPKDKAVREAALKSAEKIVDKLLWRLDTPVYFGQAVSMKAHIQVLRGQPEKASAIVDEYLSQLQELHAAIVEEDPDGKRGLMKLSPLPECLYLQAKILWDEAKAEYAKKPKRDDERVKALLFGAKNRQTAKRDGHGAFQLSINVFLKYDTSPWAAPAGEMSEEIKKFAEEKYGAKIKTAVTPEQIAKVRANQFRDAALLMSDGKNAEAAAAYLALLAKYPEIPESVNAAYCVARAWLDLAAEEEDEAKRADYRTDADAAEAYLAERFAGSANRVMMTEAGDATLRLAALEKERKEYARAERLFEDFLTNYREHPNAGTTAAQKGGEAQREERWSDAMKYWNLVARYYTNSTYYATAFMCLSTCSGKLGDKAGEIDYLNRYLAAEANPARRLQAQMQLAQLYQRNGLATLVAAADLTNETEVAEAEKRGTVEIARAIKQFMDFSQKAEAAAADPACTPEDKARYVRLREQALFLTGECWSRVSRPAEKLPAYRARAAKGYEDYVAAYPKGEYVKRAYVKLGTIYTALGDVEKTKDALARLSKEFPDSDEAKNAKPRLAKNLIEMGLRKEGTEIYAEMLRTDGAYTAGQFLNAGDALVEAKSWDYANQAYEKAIRLAATNQSWVVARGRIGLAKSAFKKGDLAEAREALDAFLADEKMSRMTMAADANFLLVEVAMEQGRTEKDATMRTKNFNAAIGALKKVRNYWSKKPAWEQDQLSLRGGDVLVKRMQAEEAMGLDPSDARERAASTFQVFIQAHAPGDDKPFDKMVPGEVANLEYAYVQVVRLFRQMGAAQADRVIEFGEAYLNYFPNGKDVTEVRNAMNQARVDLPSGGGAGAKPAAAAPAAAPAAEATPAAE